MDMLVPGPCRCEDEIALLHGTGLSIHDRDRTRALEDEAQSIHCVPVWARSFARQENLNIGRERPRGALLVLVFGRDELQHAPLHHVRRGDVDRGGEQRPDLLPRPKMSGFRCWRRAMRPRVLPQRREIRVPPCLADFANIRPGRGHRGLSFLMPVTTEQSLEHVRTLSIDGARRKPDNRQSVRLTGFGAAL